MIRVDNTLLTDFASCHAAGVARHVLGLRGKAPKIAAWVGNAFHSALEAHFTGASWPATEAAFRREYAAKIGSISVDDARYGLENCLRIARRYCETHPVERSPFKVLETERAIGVQLRAATPGGGGGEAIEFWMKRDMLVVGDDGLPVPADHKTTGRIDSWWMKSHRRGSQMTGYCWGTSQLTQLPCPGAYINAIEVFDIPSSKTKCRTHGVPYAECGIEHCKFELLYAPRTPEMIERWRQDAIAIASQFGFYRTAYSTADYLPLVPRNGAFTGACRFCEFIDWCGVGFEPSLADGYVVYDPWEPWAGGEQTEADTAADAGD